MICLNSFIQEKLKLNKDTKVFLNDITNKILKYWGMQEDVSDDEDLDFIKVINNWVEDNNVKNVYPVAHQESIREASDFLEDDIINEYQFNSNDLEKCEDYFNHSKILYDYKERGEKFTIQGTKEMICIVGWYGTLYCVSC